MDDDDRYEDDGESGGDSGEDGPAGDEASETITSTPVGAGRPASPPISPVRAFGGGNVEGVTFAFLPNARNVRRALASDWGEEEVPVEDAPRTSAAWKERKIGVLKYIDDGLQVDKINMDSAMRFELGGKKYRTKHVVPSQNLYRHVISKYKEFFVRCDRLKNSLLYYMRHRLNGKAGKTFGSRNRQYRDQ